MTTFSYRYARYVCSTFAALGFSALWGNSNS
jgi:hypothetical protein